MFRKVATLILASLLLTRCGLFDESYRFRMTVEVDTPQGVRTGSSVYEVTSGKKVKILPDARSSFLDLRGEAVAVDLKPGVTLFALLSPTRIGEDLANASVHALNPDPGPVRNIVLTVGKIADRPTSSPPVDVDREDYPLLVTFADPSVPASVARVDPGDLAATFGPVYRLRRITVQLTDDTVTRGIENRLPWLPNYYDSRLDGQRFGDGSSLANDLSSGSFSTGL